MPLGSSVASQSTVWPAAPRRVGSEPQEPGQTSASIRVPSVVPSLTQGSSPEPFPQAVKKTLPSSGTSWRGAEDSAGGVEKPGTSRNRTADCAHEERGRPVRRRQARSGRRREFLIQESFRSYSITSIE